MSRKLNKMESLIKCNECGKVFKQQWNLVRHARIHAKEKPYSCDFCAKGFSDRSNLKQHLVIHTRDTPFKCKKCEKVFSSRVHFNRHQSVHATQDLKCVICEKVFDSKKHLTSHAKFHTGENRYMCEICGRSYEKRHTLKAHMMFHSEDKPHKCNDCSKSFTSANDLRRHTVSHSDTKPFKCSECERRFSRNALLRAHNVTHTNGKQFQCLVCLKVFTYKYNLKRHELCHSEDQKTTCIDESSNMEDKLATNSNVGKSTNAQFSRKRNTKLDSLIVKIKEKVSQNNPRESENQRPLIQSFSNSLCKINRDTERTCLKNESRGFKIGVANGEDDTCVRISLETEVIDASSGRKSSAKRMSQTLSNDELSVGAIQAVVMDSAVINSNNCTDYNCDRSLVEEVVLIDSDVPVEESIEISTSI
ncbi:zinc finger protein 501 [Patella vulgata]|uniref:zinc finger protein 501 n=1 Tax=Patella vulgata TaxID=6465 RepID=UPI00218072C7|nr:zinc finger protein 501 [Patella vulgata]